ncbi:helix-turn-helix transcriptional regulator [Martelella soudanensis]|uniref:helix-turn-helix transcriptional regulator n=1 Tax=unclassified Martelella TaxID=2629616 RepID=UPI0015DD6653|nr:MULTISPECIES: helix-turn-helix transcriptional regulator [unclassified Martelella]
MNSTRLSRVPERQELSDFVRYCRERASPEKLGLRDSGRRRTKGLRREEVATLAGVGLTWYTWFEQGRDIHVSDDFLARLVRGLKLERAEQEHLYALAGRDLKPRVVERSDVPTALVAMITALPNAAYILNLRWDVLAFNDEAERLFPALREPDPNMLGIVFFCEAYRNIVRDWERSARQMFLKARHDYLTTGKDPILRCLLDKVMDEFPTARDWWKDPEVVRIGNTMKELRAGAGWKRYDLSVLLYEGRPDIRIVVYGQQA